MASTNVLPRIVLVSDAGLSRNGLGIDRTLYSLFEPYPTDRFLLYTRGRPTGDAAHGEEFIHRCVAFPQRHIRPVLTRFNGVPPVAAFHRGLSMLDFTIRAHGAVAGLASLKKFDPQVVVVCPNGPVDLLEGFKVARALARPTVVYFMDDWPANENCRWLGGDVQRVVRDLLHGADAWIMISEALARDLGARYGATPSRRFVAHNTITVDPAQAPDFAPRSGTFRISYAGSIWPMHQDAIALVADAIAALRGEGVDIELVIHCPEHFWSRYGPSLGPRGARYGGFVEHGRLPHVLRESDLLLVASSFAPEWAGHARGSLQTKVTDYMCVGRPILSVGPPGCACHEFLDRWQCGLTSVSASAADLARDLRRAVGTRETNLALARRAYDVVREHFSRETVTGAMYRFLADVAQESDQRVCRPSP